MPSAPTAPNRLLPTRGRRRRVLLFWIAFAVAAVAIAGAVHRLYATVRRELQEQGDIALGQQRAKFRERVHGFTDELRQSTIKSLASFHVEGLGYALQKWKKENAAIVGTFQWDEAQGFLPHASFPAGAPKPEELPALWQEFRAWRTRHSGIATPENVVTGAYRVAWFRTLDNPLFPAAELGYQSENLDLLNYAGRPTDPWAGWAGHRSDSSAPWIFWYQPGPGAPVRGCFVDVAPVVAKLRAELADSRVARLELAPGDGASTDADVSAWLPGFVLGGSHGDLFVGKQGEVRLIALVIASLLGIFLLGAVFLALFSQREMRDAERKATFVTQVSHELRTPLTSIRMFADMLGTPDLPEAKRARFAATISRESERLGALIERLLTFSALTKGGPVPAIVAVDVGAVVRETLEEMDAMLRAAGLAVETEFPEKAVSALTDRSALKQALLNLLENALKYARVGRVIRVMLVDEASGVRLRVADEGPGIPRELGERVFEPFVQGGRTLTDKSPGVGLGLSIARGLLRQAGGDLVLLPGEKGAVFEIRLPHVSTA